MFEMEGEKTLAEFSTFDMTLLGDIHIPQFLDGEKRIAYAGSLISQNCGEGGYEHGYLVWDIVRKTATFHPVLNRKAYVSLYIEKKVLRLFENKEEEVKKWEFEMEGESWESRAKEFWKHVPTQARVTLYGLEKESFEKVEYWIEKATSSTHTFTSFKRHYLTKSSSVSYNFSSTFSNEKENKEDEQYSTSPWSPEDVDEFLKNQSVEYSPEIRNILVSAPLRNKMENGGRKVDSWKIIKVEGKHLFGYGEFELDLEKWSIPVVVGIFGKNSFGKSTIIDILTLLLYSKITRFSHGNTVPVDVIHRLQDKAEGKLWLEVDGERVMIHKKFSRMANQKIKTVQEIWKFPQQNKGKKDEGVRLTLEDRKKMDKWVEMHVGTFDHFLNLCVQSQQHRTGFREMTQKERKEYLFHHLHLNMYESLREEYHEKNRECMTIKNELEKHPDWPSYSWRKEEDECREWEEKKELLKKNMDGIQHELERTELEMANLTGSGSYSMEIIREHQTKLQKRYEELKKSCEEVEVDVNSLVVNIKGKENEIRERDLSVEKEYDLLLEKVQSELMECKLSKPELPFFPTVSEMVNRMGGGCYHPEWLPKEGNREEEFSRGMEQCRMMREEFLQRQKERQEYEKERNEKLMEWKMSLRHLPSTSLCHQMTKQQMTVYWKECKNYQEEQFPIMEKKGLKIEKQYEVWKEKSVEIGGEEYWDNLWKQYRKKEQELQKWDWTRSGLVREKERLMETKFNKNCEICMQNPIHVRLQEVEKEIGEILEKEKSIEKFMEESKGHIGRIQKEMMMMFTIKSGKKEEMNEKWWKEKTMELEKKYEDWRMAKKKKIEIEGHLEEMEIFQENEKWLEKIKKMEAEEDCGKEGWEKLQKGMKKMESEEVLKQMMRYWVDWRDYEKKKREYKKHVKEYERRVEDKNRECKQLKLKQEWSHVHYSIVVWKYVEERERQRHELLHKVKLLREEKESLQKSHYEAHYMAEKKKTEKEKYLQWKERLKEVEKELNECHQLLPLLSRNGLPLYLLMKVLPKLEKEWNRLLSPFLEGAVLHVVMENQDIDFYMTKPDGTSSSRYFGGMEGFILDVGCKMVIHQLSYEPKPPLFIIDEGISVLDKEHLENLPIFLEFLQSMFSHILVISHIPVVRDYVDTCIYVEKKEGYSTLVNI